MHAKDLLRWPITIWFISLFLCHKRWKYRMQKQQWTRNGRSSRHFQHGNWRKSRARRQLFWKLKETKRKSTLQHWWIPRVLPWRCHRWNVQKIVEIPPLKDRCRKSRICFTVRSRTCWCPIRTDTKHAADGAPQQQELQRKRRVALTGSLHRSQDRIQRRGDARVECKKL